MGKPSVDMADNCITEVHQTPADAAFRHCIPGKGIQRDSQQSPAVHAFKHALGNRLNINAASTYEDDPPDRCETERKPDRNPQNHEDSKTDQKPCYHTATSSLSSGVSVRVTIRCTTAAKMQRTAAAGKIL